MSFAGTGRWLLGIRSLVQDRARRSARRTLTRHLELEPLEIRTLLSSTPQAIASGLPMRFEPNVGQVAAPADFVARGQDYNLYLQSTAAIWQLADAPNADNSPVAETYLRTQLVGANAGAQAKGLETSVTKTNYFMGGDPSQWHTAVTNYNKVEYQSVYSGIDLVYYGTDGQLEYDFNVAPGADPGQIQLNFDGAHGLEIADNGDLIVHTPIRDLVEHAPVIYQLNDDGSKSSISGNFVLLGGNNVAFHVGSYDQTKTLVIDPVLFFNSKTYGSSGNTGFSVSVDQNSGNAYFAGSVLATDLTTGSAIVAATYPTGTKFGGATDAFFAVVDPVNILLFVTYFGGTGTDIARGITVKSGRVDIAGTTNSTGLAFPTIGQVAQGTLAGGNDAFIAQFPLITTPAQAPATYTPILFTYCGGIGDDAGNGIAVDSTGNDYIVGTTTSNNSNFATSTAPYVVDPLGKTLNNQDAFIAVLGGGGSKFNYRTYFGGSLSEDGRAIQVDSAGNVYVAGVTTSTNLPKINQPNRQASSYQGNFDAFALKIDNRGRFVFAEYIGGANDDFGNGIDVDFSGNVYVVGETNSTSFTPKPTTGSFFLNTLAIQPFFPVSDGFLVQLKSSDGTFKQMTYIGGTGDDFARAVVADPSGQVSVTGHVTPVFTNGFINFLPTPQANPTNSVFVVQYQAGATTLNLLFSTFLNVGTQGNGIAENLNSGDLWVTGTSGSGVLLSKISGGSAPIPPPVIPPAPTISRIISDSSGPTATILGTNFPTDVYLTSVVFTPTLPNGTQLTPVNALFAVASPTMITAQVPTGFVAGSITVETLGGSASASVNFADSTDNSAFGLINGFSPGAASAGSTVTITGSNLQHTTEVDFNPASFAAKKAIFRVVNSTTVVATVPDLTGNGPITLNIGGSLTNYQVSNVSISPIVPFLAGPTSVTSVNYVDASSNNVPLAFAQSTPTTPLILIDAEVPAGITGPFTYVAGISNPTTFDLAVNNGVTINLAVPNNNAAAIATVDFTAAGGTVTAGKITVVNPSTISVAVPAGAINGPITLTDKAGNTQATAFDLALNNGVTIALAIPMGAPLPTLVNFSGPNSTTVSAFPASPPPPGAAVVMVAIPNLAVNGTISVVTETAGSPTGSYQPPTYVGTMPGAGIPGLNPTPVIVAPGIAPASITSVRYGTSLAVFAVAPGVTTTLGNSTSFDLSLNSGATVKLAVPNKNAGSITSVAFTGFTGTVPAGTVTVIDASTISVVVPVGAANGPIFLTNSTGAQATIFDLSLNSGVTIALAIPAGAPVPTLVNFSGTGSTIVSATPLPPAPGQSASIVRVNVPTSAINGPITLITEGTVSIVNGSIADGGIVATFQPSFTITYGPQFNSPGTGGTTGTTGGTTGTTGGTTGTTGGSTGNNPGTGGTGTTSSSSSYFATGSDAGSTPNVQVFDGTSKALVFSFLAYNTNFRGGVRVAVGDVNGDKVPDIITGPGPGGGPDIKVFNGTNGSLMMEFFAFNPGFAGGVYVAAGDLSGAGYDNIIVSADAGGGPNVVVFDGKSGARTMNFFAYDPRFIGGVRVAAGDIDGNGIAEVICGAGPGGGPNVSIFDSSASLISSFFAYDPRFTLGIYVAASDTDGSGRDEVITGAGAGGGPNVAVFDGIDGINLLSFMAYDPRFVGGVRVASVDRNGDGKADILTTSGPGGGADLRTFDGPTGSQVDAFFSYNPPFSSGLFIGAGK